MQKKGKFLQIAEFNTMETALRDKTEKAVDINGFFRNLKLQELMTAQTIDEMSTILLPILV